MNEKDIAEQAYKNGYEQGVNDLAKTLKEELLGSFCVQPKFLIDLYVENTINETREKLLCKKK